MSCKHHSQNHETQNTNTQTASAKDISTDIAIIFAVIHGALVCVVDATADTISNVTQFFSHIVLLFERVVTKVTTQLSIVDRRYD
jgi:hypothetical protein